MNTIFIVSDIFGVTLALKQLVTELNEKLSNTALTFIIVDPYNEQSLNFKNEADAYAYFTEHSSIEKYAKHLSDIITQSNSHNNCKVIGFSVGASAMWSIADNVDLQVEHAIYFYGSQIRYTLNVKPHIQSTMIFPQQEEHFDVQALSAQLKNKKKVVIKPCCFNHGFMNKHSVNYSKEGYRTYINWLSEQLS